MFLGVSFMVSRKSLLIITFYIIECPDGRFGVNCEHECHCAVVEEKCDPVDGSCHTGCHPPWSGPGCQDIN